MVIMERDVNISMVIEPVFWGDLPEIRIEFNGQTLYHDRLAETLVKDWLLSADLQNRLSVFLLNKRDADTAPGRDKAVKISKLGLENLFFPSISHQSRYRPIYSNGYHDYAEKNGIKVEPVIHSNYLGFNGEWYLEFTWPVFSWIYSIETNDMGWVYEKNI